jgi:hypothetical protein
MTTSLLPELHIAVLHAKDICESLAQALNLSQLQAANSAVLISGPSRTADIEMTLTIGVHGRRLVCSAWKNKSRIIGLTEACAACAWFRAVLLDPRRLYGRRVGLVWRARLIWASRSS